MPGWGRGEAGGWGRLWTLHYRPPTQALWLSWGGGDPHSRIGCGPLKWASQNPALKVLVVLEDWGVRAGVGGVVTTPLCASVSPFLGGLCSPDQEW